MVKGGPVTEPGGDMTYVQWPAPDRRRAMQLVLAALWLFDAVLQLQPFMFSHDFGAQMIKGAALGDPGVLAAPARWAATQIAHHAQPANATFAAIQLAIGIGIAWRQLAKIALTASIAWAVGVWWIGEGFGGLLSANASPINGAPGAVVLYAVLGLLLWPTSGWQRESPFEAGKWTGPKPAKAIWFLIWAGMAALLLKPSAHARQGISNAIKSMASGEPGWISSLDLYLSHLSAHRGSEIAAVLGVLLLAVATSVFLPSHIWRIGVVVAIAIAGAIWLIGEGLGGLFSGQGTDPNTGPLLALLGAAYWPRPTPRAPEGSGVEPLVGIAQSMVDIDRPQSPCEPARSAGTQSNSGTPVDPNGQASIVSKASHDSEVVP